MRTRSALSTTAAVLLGALLFIFRNNLACDSWETVRNAAQAEEALWTLLYNPSLESAAALSCPPALPASTVLQVFQDARLRACHPQHRFPMISEAAFCFGYPDAVTTAADCRTGLNLRFFFSPVDKTRCGPASSGFYLDYVAISSRPGGYIFQAPEIQFDGRQLSDLEYFLEGQRDAGTVEPVTCMDARGLSDGQATLEPILSGNGRHFWSALKALTERYPGCDDGEMAEAYSDLVVRGLARRNSELQELAVSLRHPPFHSFVLKHIDASASKDDLKSANENVRRCPADLSEICAALRSATKEAGVD